MNVIDLAQELESRTEHPRPGAAVARLDSVRTRIRRRRRRQAATAVLLAGAGVGAFVLGSSLGALPSDRSSSPAGRHEVRPYTFDDVLAADPLAASAVGRRGQREVVLRFTPADTDLMLAAFCHLDADGSSLLGRSTVNGHPFLGTGCLRSSVANSSSSTPGPAAETPEQVRAAWAGLGVVPGQESQIRIQLQTDRGAARTDPSVRLGVGLYTRHGERIVSDGVVIKKDAEADGHDYRLAEYTTQIVGLTSRRVSLWLPAGHRPPYVVAGVDGAGEKGAGAETWLVVDDRQHDGSAGGGTFSGVLDDARAHTLEVRTGSSTGTLLLAYYVRAD